jgi:hypothetical protein
VFPITFFHNENNAMNNHNRISAELTDELIDEVIADIRAIRAKLSFLVSLNAQDRRELPKMGEKSIGFDEKCVTYMSSHSEFMPGFVDTEELARDRKLRTQLLRIQPVATCLADVVDDGVMLSNSDIWMADLSYYQAVRTACKRGIPGAEAIYEDLRTRFPGGGRPASDTPAEPTTPANEPTTLVKK